MTTRHCITQLMKGYEDLTKEEAQEIVNIFDNLHKKYKGDPKTLKNKARKTQEEIVASLTRAHMAAMDRSIKLNQLIEHSTQKGFRGNLAEAELSNLEGTSRNVRGSSTSVENVWSGNRARISHMVAQELEVNGLDKAALSGDIDKAVANEVYMRGMKGYKPDSNPMVVKYADVVNKTYNELLELLQASGSVIEGKPGYVMRQADDYVKVLGDKEGWIKSQTERLDLMESFGTEDLLEVRGILEKHLKKIDSLSVDEAVNFSGGERVFIYKSGADFMEHHNLFGNGTIYDNLLSAIDRETRKAALVHKFGNRPMQAMENYRKVMKQLHPKNESLASGAKAVDNAIDIIRGTGDKPGYGVWQSAYEKFRAARMVVYMSKLGMASLATVNDLSSLMITIKTANNSGILSSTWQTISQVIQSAPPGKKGLYLDLYSIELDDVAQMALEFGRSEKPGLGQKVLSGFMQANGVRPATKWWRRAAADKHARILTDIVHTKKLNRMESQTLGSIDLSDVDIEILRKLSKNGSDKSGWVTPKIVRDAPLEAFSHVEGSSKKHKMVLEQKLAAYMNDRVNTASPIPGAKQRRQMGKHLRQDDPFRLVADSVSMIKGTLLKSTAAPAEMMRAVNPGGELLTLNSALHVAPFLVTAGAMAFGLRQVRNTIKGKELDEINIGSVARAMVDSGLAGVWGDMILGDYLNYGKTVSDVVGGPMVDEVMQYYKLARRVSDGVRGNKDHLSGDEWLKILQRRSGIENFWLWPVVKNHIMQQNMKSNF